MVGSMFTRPVKSRCGKQCLHIFLEENANILVEKSVSSYRTDCFRLVPETLEPGVIKRLTKTEVRVPRIGATNISELERICMISAVLSHFKSFLNHALLQTIIA